MLLGWLSGPRVDGIARHFTGSRPLGVTPSRSIASYLGTSDTFDRAIVEFATRYADQNERDHAALADAVKPGRLTAEAVR